MKKLIVISFLLFVGCGPPPFTVERCLTECSQCPDLPCDWLCNQIETGVGPAASIECQTAAQDIWVCAVEAGCDFPTVCVAPIEVYLMCE